MSEKRNKKTVGDKKRNYGRSKRSASKDRKKSEPLLPKASREMLGKLDLNFDESTYIVFDIETTGGNPEKNGITEICALKVHKGEVVQKFYTLVNPERSIPPIVRRMTNITNQMVRNAPKIDEVMPEFVQFIEEGVLVSHNTIGDMKFLRFYSEKVLGRAISNFFLCTHLLVEKLVKEAPNKSLKGLAEFLKISVEGELHRADSDALVTLRLFDILVGRLKRHGFDKVIDAIRFQGDFESGCRLGWAVDKNDLKSIPEKPGVFFLRDHRKKVVLVSSATNLKRDISKLKKYNQLPRAMLRIVLSSYSLNYTECDTILSALIRETKEVSKRSIYDPGNWHQRNIFCLQFILKGSSVHTEIGPLKVGAIAAFGPIGDRKGAKIVLDKFLNKCGESSGIKQKGFDPGFLPEAAAFFSAQISNYKISFSLSGFISRIFSPKFRDQLQKRQNLVSKLKKVEMPYSWSSVRDVNGTAFIRDGSGRLVVRKVVRSKLLAWRRWESIEGDHFEITSQLIDKYRFIRPVKAPRMIYHPLTKSSAIELNRLLWWVYSSANKRDGGFVFSEQGVSAD